MRIAVATGGRYHVLDLARELDALGHELRFYSYVSRRRAKSFGLSSRCHVPLFPLMAPVLAAERVLPVPFARHLSHAGMRALDCTIARVLRPCDVLVAMSGLFVETLKAAKKRYRATVILERGSRHILSQDQILRDMPGGQGVDAFAIPRELEGYELADFISIPSRHVAESFLAFGVPRTKLLVNPFGCDLKMFPPTRRNRPSQKTVLFVGTWSLRKGCDILVEAWRKLDGIRLMHVGPLDDAPLPADEGFVHIDAVSQEKLSAFYAEGDVFVLASREEGLALVQAQALASGLPIVCTTRTGGADLGELLGCQDAVFEVPPDDTAALAQAITRAVDRANTGQEQPRVIAGNLDRLSWRAYGERYDRFLRDIRAQPAG